MRILLDTRTLLEMMSASPQKDELLQLKVMHEFGDVELWASALSLKSLGIAIEESCEEELVDDVMADTLTWLRVCPVGESEFRSATFMQGRTYESRLDLACARQIGAAFLVSSHGDDVYDNHLPHGTTREFMQYVSKELGVRYAVVGLD